MHSHGKVILAIILPVCIFSSIDTRAQGHPNGNRLALDFTRGNQADREHLRETSARVVHTFRYLEITEIEKDQPEQPRRVDIVTVEPSSDMEVHLIVTRGQRQSMQWAESLEIGDHIAADGRLVDLATRTENRMILQPVRINFKDRASPKHGPELLREVDPTAH